MTSRGGKGDGVRGELNLNKEQRRAAEAGGGAVLVIAGAGTGKTMTLVHRLVALCRSGVDPASILLLTFTRRAAEEMIRRASDMLGGGRRAQGGTFHSYAHAMLRRRGRAVGVAPGFTVLDQGDTFEIISSIRSDMNVPRGFPRRQTISAVLSKAVNKQVPVEKVIEQEYPQFLEESPVIDDMGRKYAAYKAERGLLDFDDLLVKLIELLERSDVRQLVGRNTSYVMVDEYQDTNVLQARITQLLAEGARNVMVVGDDAQSIYGFRGACYTNLFEFSEQFEQVERVTLEQNYRSTQPILDVANGLMKQMSRTFRKKLFTRRRGGNTPRLVEVFDEHEQARWVADEVERLREDGVRLRDIGVLFRAARHAFSLELELGSRDIPYVKFGGFRFFETAHIKDVLAHLRLVNNPFDDVSGVRVLMLLDGVGRKGALKILRSVGQGPIGEELGRLELSGRKKEGVSALSRVLQDIQGKATPARKLERVLEYYEPKMKLLYDDWPRREKDLRQLLELCRRYRSVERMLSELALDPPTTSSRDTLASRVGNELVLSTIHSAKGLEWDHVFVIQALDGCLPMINPYEDEDEETLDEELRLLYVAVTRARDELALVFPRETARGYGFGWADPSRFISALPDRLLHHVDVPRSR
jgi:DNA helicase-2/ATP-dependent DNA helicase PcrA